MLGRWPTGASNSLKPPGRDCDNRNLRDQGVWDRWRRATAEEERQRREQGGGVCQCQAPSVGAPSAENQWSQSQVPVSEERAGTNQTVPDAGAAQMDHWVWATAGLRSGLTGVSGSSGDSDGQTGDQSQLLQSPSHDDHLLWCVLKTSVDRWRDGEPEDGEADEQLDSIRCRHLDPLPDDKSDTFRKHLLNKYILLDDWIVGRRETGMDWPLDPACHPYSMSPPDVNRQKDRWTGRWRDKRYIEVFNRPTHRWVSRFGSWRQKQKLNRIYWVGHFESVKHGCPETQPDGSESEKKHQTSPREHGFPEKWIISPLRHLLHWAKHLGMYWEERSGERNKTKKKQNTFFSTKTEKEEVRERRRTAPHLPSFQRSTF